MHYTLLLSTLAEAEEEAGAAAGAAAGAGARAVAGRHKQGQAGMQDKATPHDQHHCNKELTAGMSRDQKQGC